MIQLSIYNQEGAEVGQMDVDEVVKMAEIRRYLAAFAEMAYQSIGYRTIRNPRIWSLHDLLLLTDEPR